MRYTHFIICFVIVFFIPQIFVFAATNIDGVDRWAWNDVIGYINFARSNTVIVSSLAIVGYADTDVGPLILDCPTANQAPFTAGLNCANYPGWAMTNNGAGLLGGFAWNDVIGWVSFSCASGGDCSTHNYGVTIDPASGDFNGFAWNDVIGWISFNGLISPPGVGSYKVKTSWTATPTSGELISSVIDAGSAVYWNTIKWIGSLHGGAVQFQVATLDHPSSVIGDWSFVNPQSCSSGFSIPSPSDVPQAIACAPLQHTRYLRYKIRLGSNLGRTRSPQVDDIVVTWSR